MSTKTPWCDENNDITDKASDVLDSLSFGVAERETAKDLDVDPALIKEWLADPAFVADLEDRKKSVRESITRGITLTSNCRLKKDYHESIVAYCSFDYLTRSKTDKQRSALMKKYLSAIKWAVKKGSNPKNNLVQRTWRPQANTSVLSMFEN